MVLKKITIHNLGAITHLSHEFGEGITALRDRRRDELSFAICLMLGHKIAPPPSISVGVETEVMAEITLHGHEYRVVAKPKKRKRTFELLCTDASGMDVTVEYLYLVRHSCEQDLTDVFSGDAEDAFFGFLKYASEDAYYSRGELSSATDGLSDLKAFRRYLREFLEGFEPETLRDGKGYEIILLKSGKYAVRCMHDGSITRSLSESEKMIFKYLCFLRTAEFWHGFEELRNLHSIKKPLIISGFLERLDESIDVRELLDRTERLERQTILITNKDIEYGVE